MLQRSTFVIALILFGSATFDSRAGAQCHTNRGGGTTVQGQPIYVQNNSGVPLWVAARYIPPGSSSHVNDGYWRVEPGQRLLILYNKGVWLYLGARLDDGTSIRLNRSSIRETIRGLPVDLFPFDTGTDYNPRVITLSR